MRLVARKNLIACMGLVVALLTPMLNIPAANAQDPNPPSRFDAPIAFEHLTNVCAIGPRPSTSTGMQQQQAYLKEHFAAIGGAVTMQPFLVADPRTGDQARLSNMMVRWHPDRKRRLLLCCHYDTRPFPDRDPHNPTGVFIGANDGGSGVAVLCELGRHIPAMSGNFGVDLLFFDGEEFVYVHRRDPMFLGSTFFAQQYAAGNHDAKYEFAVLIDMVGDAKLQIKIEGNSLDYAGRLTRSIWAVAKKQNVREFVPRRGPRIRDDHLPLNTIARIPTCDIIDFDYPTPQSKNAFWHTTQDTIENCSAESLEKVGRVLLEWVREMQQLN